MIGHLEWLEDAVGLDAVPFNALGMVCKRVGGHGTAQQCQPGIFCTFPMQKTQLPATAMTIHVNGLACTLVKQRRRRRAVSAVNGPLNEH